MCGCVCVVTNLRNNFFGKIECCCGEFRLIRKNVYYSRSDSCCCFYGFWFPKKQLSPSISCVGTSICHQPKIVITTERPIIAHILGFHKASFTHSLSLLKFLSCFTRKPEKMRLSSTGTTATASGDSDSKVVTTWRQQRQRRPRVKRKRRRTTTSTTTTRYASSSSTWDAVTAVFVVVQKLLLLLLLLLLPPTTTVVTASWVDPDTPPRQMYTKALTKTDTRSYTLVRLLFVFGRILKKKKIVSQAPVSMCEFFGFDASFHSHTHTLCRYFPMNLK
jgi:hypothetical protein